MRAYLFIEIDQNGLVDINRKNMTETIYKKAGIQYWSTREKNTDSANLIQFLKQNYGVAFHCNDKEIEIYTDPFRSVPLYVYKNNKNKLFIFTDFSDIEKIPGFLPTIDKTGVWESIIYSGCLWSRTIYKGLNQIPAACKLSINISSLDYSITQYYNFEAEYNSKYENINNVTDTFYELFSDIILGAPKASEYLMGLSGGLDSRLALCFLTKAFSKDQIKLFTFGYNKNILEYQYAIKTTEILGLSKPDFYKLTNESYKKFMTDLPIMSGGHVGINHCHITDYLKNGDVDLNDTTMISNCYSDALLGFAARSKKNTQTESNNGLINTLDDFHLMDNDIYDEIVADIKHLFSLFDPQWNYTNFDEYKYIMERNQKFHMYMAYLHSDYLPVYTPYANIKMTDFMFSVPLHVRDQKMIIDIVLNKYFSEVQTLLKENVSSRIWTGDGISKFKIGKSLFKNWDFRFLNGVNSGLLGISGGRLHIVNKYLTENHGSVLHSQFRNELNGALEGFLSSGLLNKQVFSELRKMPLRTRGNSERFNIIGIWEIIKKINEI